MTGGFESIILYYLFYMYNYEFRFVAFKCWLKTNSFYLPGAFLDSFTNSSLTLLAGEGLQLELDPGLFPGCRVSCDPESPGLSLIGEDIGVEELIGIPISLRIEEQRFWSIRGVSRFRSSLISLTFLSVPLEAKTILLFQFRLSALSSEEFILFSRTNFSFFIKVIFTTFPFLFSSFLSSSSCSLIGRLFSFLSSVLELEPGDGSSIPGLEPGDGSSIPGLEHGYGSSIPGLEPWDGSSIPGLEPGDGSSIPGREPGDGSSIPGLEPGDSVSFFETWFLVSPILISSSIRISPGAAR